MSPFINSNGNPIISNFAEYILVIDTEGLRAPELGEHNYIHDTEFASFIIGLADINIVNIMGEHSLEMNDVLQMVVHTLLRLNIF
jgi:hypothetical protein